MSDPGFSSIASSYETKSVVQKQASEGLFELLDLKGAEDVLDVACGPGNLTKKVRGMTTGRVVGTDAAEGMIKEARGKYGNENITFITVPAEGMEFSEEFDVVMCNSAFMWFPDPEAAARTIHRALRPGGRFVMQAPAKKIYCPNFVNAANAAANDPRTANAFAGFTPPWFLLETEAEYAAFFGEAGFTITHCRIAEEVMRCTPEEVFRFFSTGAILGYLGEENYKTPIDETYKETFTTIVKKSFQEQAAADGLVTLVFNRVYMKAVK